MAFSIGARELRSRVAEVLRAVREGERVTLTYRGRPVAEIRPIGRRKPATDDAFGMWRGRRDLKEVRRWVRAGREARPRRSSSTRTS